MLVPWTDTRNERGAHPLGPFKDALPAVTVLAATPPAWEMASPIWISGTRWSPESRAPLPSRSSNLMPLTEQGEVSALASATVSLKHGSNAAEATRAQASD